MLVRMNSTPIYEQAYTFDREYDIVRERKMHYTFMKIQQILQIMTVTESTFEEKSTAANSS